MLPRDHRLTRSDDFRLAVRGGRRAGSPRVVVHLAASQEIGAPARVGFVVSKQVGPSVTRNRVKRRLRHLVGEQLAAVPAASMLVVRAQPAAATATYGELRDDLARCLERVTS